MHSSFTAVMISFLQSNTPQHSCGLLTMATGCIGMKHTKFCWM